MVRLHRIIVAGEVSMAKGDWENPSSQVILACLSEEKGIGLTIEKFLNFPLNCTGKGTDWQ